MHPRTPVMVGVGQIQHRMVGPDDIVEPIELMIRACRQAEVDTGVRLLDKAQSVRVIRGFWTYENPARRLAEIFGCQGAETVGTLYGGNYNQVVVNDTAEAIVNGGLDIAVISGAEVGYSLAKLRKAGTKFPFSDLPGEYDRVFGRSQMPEHHENEIAKGIQQAIQVYPMYDNAIRFHRGETIDQHLTRISELWSRFSEVATTNPHAWIREAKSAPEIRTASAGNRPVSFPYTKLMNSNNAVDMGAALIMCSAEKAKALGISEDRWVYPWAGVEGRDHFSASVRDNFYSSPAIRFVGRRLFELTNLSPDGLCFIDLYSCFPSAVQVAAAELGLSEKQPLTVTGGLTFGGGPLNNYVMHSIASMVDLLRENPDKKGLITANGGNLYKQAQCIYSGSPPEEVFQRRNVQAEIDALPARNCLARFDGSVTTESYTVMYGAEGPALAHIACLNDSGDRVWVNTDDPGLMSEMITAEYCGRNAIVRNDEISFR